MSNRTKKYCVVYRQLSDNDDGLGWVDVNGVDAYEDEPSVPFLVGKLSINTDKYGNPKYIASVTGGLHDSDACLCCERGYFDLESNDLEDIEMLAEMDCIDVIWHGGSRAVKVKLPVEWLEHKVRKFTWSGELVQAGTEKI